MSIANALGMEDGQFMRMIDITNKEKYFGERTSGEKIEVGTISDKPEIYVDNEQDRKALERVYEE